MDYYLLSNNPTTYAIYLVFNYLYTLLVNMSFCKKVNPKLPIKTDPRGNGRHSPVV